MGTYTQDRRPIRIQTELGPDELLLYRMDGHERISEPYVFNVELLSENPSIDVEKMLKSKVTLEIDVPGDEMRPIHGWVRRFSQGERREDLTLYRAEIVPALWFQKLTRDSRIFQEMSVQEIVSTILDEAKIEFQFEGDGSALRAYCVQYQESNFDFVSRLLEEEGLWYYFKHTASSHKLVIVDPAHSPLACKGPSPTPLGPEPRPETDVIHEVLDEIGSPTRRVTLRDFNYEVNPTSPPEGMREDGKGEALYEYPGGFVDIDDADRYAKIRIEQRMSHERILRGSGTNRAFEPGTTFTLDLHYRNELNAEYLLVEVVHQAHVGDYRSWEGAESDYSNAFLAVPKDTRYRTRRVTPRPIIHGTQTAIVVGPSGEEIYTDDLGRVKVQFHWDRVGARDENSSCFIRVATPWAGQGWGAVHIPRIGQEVVIDFLEGNPDRPLIVGSVYNATHRPPWPLPNEMTRSGVMSQSTKGGSTSNANIIRFEDLKDSEEIYIQAEKDQTILVKNDRSDTVENDETIAIARDRTESVGRDEKITIARKQDVEIGDTQKLYVKKSRTVTIDDAETVTVKKARTEDIGKASVTKVGDSRSVDVKKNDTLSAGKKILIDGGSEIVLKSGSASITLKKNGDIVLKGKNIKIDGKSKVDVKGSSGVTVKGAQVKIN